jgi:hypothetical protein
MYIITGEGLGQQPDLSNCMADFLYRIGTSPSSDYKKLLLLARLHPFPGAATSIGSYQVTGATGTLALSDCALYAKWDLSQVADQLRRISDAKLNTEEIKAENQLWARVIEALKKVDRSKVKKFLLQPALLALLEPALLDPRKMRHPTSSDVFKFKEIGARFSGFFGQEFLDLSKSEAADAHLVKLGHLLLTRYAIGDPAFKQAVRKRRRAEERQFQQNLRYLQKHALPGLPPLPVTRPPSGSRGRR